MSYRKSLGTGALYARVAARRSARDEAAKIFGTIGLVFITVLAVIPAVIYFN